MFKQRFLIAIALMAIVIASCFNLSKITDSEEAERDFEAEQDISLNPVGLDDEIKNFFLEARLNILELREMNPDAVGWLNVDGTAIDYPVVQASNNSYYLLHAFTGEESRNGAIFLDAHLPNSILSRHNIIHGHHTRDGSMFANLVLFKDEDFFRQNKIITYENLYYATEWEIFSVYLMADDEEIPVSFASDDDFIEYANQVAKRSLFPVAIDFTANDILLTLNTCSYEFEGAHTMISARLIGVE